MTEKKESKATSAKDQKSTDQKNQNEKNTDNKSLTQSNKKDKTTDKKTVVKDKENSGNKLLWVFIAILVVVVLATFLLINNRLNKIEKDVQQSNADSSSIEKNINAGLGSRLKTVLSEVSNVQQKLNELESKQDVLSHSLAQPAEQQIHINKDYALAEIEHLLIIANYNLQLDHNVATALSAMEAVDTRLKAFTDAAAISAREQLIADMNELRSLNQADLSGMALYLSDLISRVDDLELKENVVIEQKFETDGQQQETQESVKGIKHFFTLVWDELKSLVVITRDNEIAAARLLPDEVYFLRANLKLELANARFAVFNRDTENLHMSIKHMQNWLQSYFDLSDANVRNIYDTLSTMKKTKLEFPELDISSSLESIRALSRIKEESINDGNNTTGKTIE